MSQSLEQLPISKRLKMNAALVPSCKVLADIGCDHAYSSIFLAGNGRAKRCIAMDVVKGPLSKAQENIVAYGLSDRIETRLSNGLEKLAPGEAEVLLFSGMGGPLILELLKAKPKVTGAVKALVLQPQSELARVRKELTYLGFEIIKEDMCFDEGKYYTAMLAVPVSAEGVAKKCDAGENAAACEVQAMNGNLVEKACEAANVGVEDFSLKYGSYLLDRRHPVLLAFLERELAQKKELVQKLSGQDTERASERTAVLAKEIDEIEEYLGEGNR